MNLEELNKDLDEIKMFAVQATRQRTKDILSIAQRKIETDIESIKQKANIDATLSVSNDKSSNATTDSKRYLVELNEYAWDQSDKFVKMFITLDGVQKTNDSDIDLVFTENSMILTVKNVNNKDYRLTINHLLSPIVVEKSYHKIKTDMIAIYMKKCEEGKNWSHLTLTEKKLHDMKDSALKENTDDVKDDPTAGIMNLMKTMYQTGDSEMKRMIAKAWTENQDKSRNNNMEL